MKLAVAGKGGVGKTSLTAWLADYLARSGKEVWLVDADTALSLGAALGLAPENTPRALTQEEELIRERVGDAGFISLSPKVDDLPERLCARVRSMNLLVMGSIASAGGGCACTANALLKALLAHLALERDVWLLVDLEAGVEHLGRGTIQAVDGLIVVSEPSLRSLRTAESVSRMARELGLARQIMVINRAPDPFDAGCLPQELELPPVAALIPRLASLEARQLADGRVLDLPEQPELDRLCAQILETLSSLPAKIEE
jgi:CO dehydrogenase maturation factor